MNRLLLLGLVFLLALVSNCFGQASAINGQIEGTITDPSGAVVPNATVIVANIDTGFTRTLRTDASGFFRFTVLPLGTYKLTAEAAGFAREERPGIVITAGSTATVNLGLGLAGVERNIVVTATAPIVEPGRTDLGSMLTTNQTENLPLLSRNPYK